MCTIRPHSLFIRRETQPLLAITSPGDHLPLDVDWSQRSCILPENFKNVINDIYNFEVKSDDVFVVTFPKCGTTWAQEATWLIYNDLNYEKANSEHLVERSVFMDISGIDKNVKLKYSVDMARDLPSPRLLKSHLPANLIPRQIWEKKLKTIYVARNPKDAVVSYYHFYIGLGFYRGTIDEFVHDFIHGDITYSPFWDHVLEFWRMRNEPNVLFFTYEDMKRDLESVLRKITRFLEKPELTEDQMAKLLDHLSFKNMRANPKIDPVKGVRDNDPMKKNLTFMRRGIAGAYKDELSVENQRKIDEWTDNYLKEYNVTVKDIFGEI